MQSVGVLIELSIGAKSADGEPIRKFVATLQVECTGSEAQELLRLVATTSSVDVSVEPSAPLTSLDHFDLAAQERWHKKVNGKD